MSIRWFGCIIFVGVLMSLIACSGDRSQRECLVNQDCPVGFRCDDGSCQVIGAPSPCENIV